MRLRAWAWLALSSFVADLSWCATRPHYGGALAVDLSTTFNTLDPAELPPNLASSIAETLTAIDARGELEPRLAESWQREADGRRWRISLRTRVLFHDGQPLNATNTAPALLAALKKTHPDVVVTAGGQTLVIQSDQGLPNLPVELAAPAAAIIRTGEGSSIIGTGPFRVAGWEPGRKLTLAAFEDYWGGRPYLDSVAINLGSSGARADVFDIPFASARRILPENTRVWSSSPRELIVLVANGVEPAVVQALALSIDRVPIVNVLAQHRGEPAFGLLPEWLSGYEFLFETPPDLARAKQLISGVKLSPLTLSYPPTDSFARAVAERVALNARDAGITVQAVPGSNGKLRLVRWLLNSPDAARELDRLAVFLGVSLRVNYNGPPKLQSMFTFEGERAILDSNRIIPLVHLPLVYGLAPRVHSAEKSPSTGAFSLRLENLWVDP